MRNHTKGKWKVLGNSGYENQTLISRRVAHGRDPIGVVYGDPNSDETKSNAALFAAAPELLEILTKIVHEYDQTYDADCEGGRWKGAASIPVELMERAKELCK